ncbi:aspartate carbamoyltransferase catalytic subunit [Chloroherpeton thalassium]|uniref:aspartate carbamoyltransferase catalytic subunit n=1 Tax=Chloroherpeton thalassium TaxID=100716 RepID=UPI00059C9931|nr:aspartate carbamoyltransferase catalytic subunit [Chloroherpeton thalassium]
MKHLLGLYHTSHHDISSILDLASFYKKSIMETPSEHFSDLMGKIIVLAFFENSTRTRTSFDLAARKLGASTVNFTASASSIQKGETMLDTIATLEAMQVDAFIVRHKDSGAPHTIAKHSRKTIINAGDGTHEHPTQALLDMLTLQETFGKLNGLKILILGDILHSRVARSNIFGLQKMGAEVSVCAPTTLLPTAINAFGVKVYHDLNRAVSEVDAVIVLRIQLERESGGYIPSINEYSSFYALTEEKLSERNGKLVVLHPGPINREIELSGIIADETCEKAPSQSKILNQVTNGIAVRMSVLKHLL